jgi:hypothetical protein
MQVIEKYLIVTLLIAMQCFIGLREPGNLAKWTDRKAVRHLTNNQNSAAKSEINVVPSTDNNTEMSDSLKMDGKIWMVKQNIIIGY